MTTIEDLQARLDAAIELIAKQRQYIRTLYTSRNKRKAKTPRDSK